MKRKELFEKIREKNVAINQSKATIELINDILVESDVSVPPGWAKNFMRSIYSFWIDCNRTESRMKVKYVEWLSKDIFTVNNVENISQSSVDMRTFKNINY